MSVFLGIDYGEKRIGLAISDETGTFAVPSETLAHDSREQVFAHIQRVVKEKGIEKIVVGLPLSLSGAYSEQTEKTQDFVHALGEQILIPVDTHDERLTSAAADRGGIDVSTRDARAAAIMLQNYLDQVKKKGI